MCQETDDTAATDMDSNLAKIPELISALDEAIKMTTVGLVKARTDVANVTAQGLSLGPDVAATLSRFSANLASQCQLRQEAQQMVRTRPLPNEFRAWLDRTLAQLCLQPESAGTT